MSKNSFFGPKALFSSYFKKDFFLDSIIPFVISLGLCLIMYFKKIDIYVQLLKLLDVSISIVPAMVALILAAYTILLSFLLGDGFKETKKSDEGKALIRSLNSSFAACLILSAITIIVCIICSCIANYNIFIENSNIVNYIVYFLVAYLLTYTVIILFGIVIDLFNIGQTSLFK